MNLFQIKICGITRPEDAIDAINFGADALGLNFYDRSPRFATDSVAQSVVDAVASIRTNPAPASSGSVKLVGVFVNTPVGKMIETTRRFDLCGIQLHGDESPEIVSEVRRELSSRECYLIRAIRTKPAGADAATGEELQRVEQEILDWASAGVDSVLLDAAVPGEFGGTGEVVDWTSVPRLSTNVPLTLAGGLKPDNVAQAINVSEIRSVDVASGVESNPGIKDRSKVEEFIRAATEAMQ